MNKEGKIWEEEFLAAITKLISLASDPAIIDRAEFIKYVKSFINPESNFERVNAVNEDDPHNAEFVTREMELEKVSIGYRNGQGIEAFADYIKYTRDNRCVKELMAHSIVSTSIGKPVYFHNYFVHETLFLQDCLAEWFSDEDETGKNHTYMREQGMPLVYLRERIRFIDVGDFYIAV